MKNFSRAVRYLGALLLAVTFSACSDDPTDASLGSPAFIQPSFTVLNAVKSTVVSLTAVVRDAQLNQLGERIAATSSKPALVRVDSTTYVSELNETRFRLVIGNTTTLDSANVILTGGGLTDTTKVYVSP